MRTTRRSTNLMRYGIPLPQTPTAQEGSLEKSEQNRKLALDRLARIDDHIGWKGLRRSIGLPGSDLNHQTKLVKLGRFIGHFII